LNAVHLATFLLVGARIEYFCASSESFGQAQAENRGHFHSRQGNVDATAQCFRFAAQEICSNEHLLMTPVDACRATVIHLSWWMPSLGQSTCIQAHSDMPPFEKGD
jgi:hypothetical protein